MTTRTISKCRPAGENAALPASFAHRHGYRPCQPQMGGYRCATPMRPTSFTQRPSERRGQTARPPFSPAATRRQPPAYPEKCHPSMQQCPHATMRRPQEAAPTRPTTRRVASVLAAETPRRRSARAPRDQRFTPQAIRTAQQQATRQPRRLFAVTLPFHRCREEPTRGVTPARSARPVSAVATALEEGMLAVAGAQEQPATGMRRDTAVEERSRVPPRSEHVRGTGRIAAPGMASPR